MWFNRIYRERSEKICNISSSQSSVKVNIIQKKNRFFFEKKIIHHQSILSNEFEVIVAVEFSLSIFKWAKTKLVHSKKKIEINIWNVLRVRGRRRGWKSSKIMQRLNQHLLNTIRVVSITFNLAYVNSVCVFFGKYAETIYLLFFIWVYGPSWYIYIFCFVNMYFPLSVCESWQMKKDTSQNIFNFNVSLMSN